MRAGGDPERCLVIITPGRMMVPVPVPSRLDGDLLAAVRRLVPEESRNIAVIAFNDLLKLELPDHVKKQGITAQTAKSAIPFLGLLLALAYNKHKVVVFEGHPSALAFACHEADVLMIDQAMQAYLQEDWHTVARAAMRSERFLLLGRDGRILAIDPESGQARAANPNSVTIHPDQFDAVVDATHAGPLPLGMADPESYAVKSRKRWWWPFG